MAKLGLHIAKALARELDCEVISYQRHGRHGGVVTVSGTYDPAFMQSLLRTAADLCSARGYPVVAYLVGGASTEDNAKGRVGSHTAVLGDWGVRGSKSGDSTFASFAFEFSEDCGLLADGNALPAGVGLEATVCRDVGAAFRPRYPAMQCGNKAKPGANFLFDLIKKTGLVYVVLATKPSTEPRDLLLEAERSGADVTRGGGISRGPAGPQVTWEVNWMQALLYLVATRGLAQRNFVAIAAALNEAFGLKLTQQAVDCKYGRIAKLRETASPKKMPVSEAEVAVALDAKQSAETHLADLRPEVVRVLKARAAALAAGDDADDVLTARAARLRDVTSGILAKRAARNSRRAARRRDQALLEPTALGKLDALFVVDAALFFAAESSSGESSGESSSDESSSDSSDDDSSSDEAAAPAMKLRRNESSLWALRRIVPRTGCVVVLSSTAPRGVAAALGGVIGAEKLKATAAVTSSGSAADLQVREVFEWLEQRPADRWVCLDDATGGLREAYVAGARAAGAAPVFAARFVSAAASFDEDTLRAVTFDEEAPLAAAAPDGLLPFLPRSHEITRADIAGRHLVVTGKNFLPQRILELVLEIRFGANIMRRTSSKTHIVIGPASCLEGDPADQSANAKCALYTPTEDPKNGGHAVFLEDTKLEAMLRDGEVADALQEKRGSLPPLRYVTVENALAGRPWRRQVCVVTGEVDGYDQVDFLVALRDTLGAKTWDRVTDDTTLLIVGDLGGRESSTKLDAARVLKVKIVRAADVLKLLASPPVFAKVTNRTGKRPAKKTPARKPAKAPAKKATKKSAWNSDEESSEDDFS
jgi:hypothetical protein